MARHKFEKEFSRKLQDREIEPSAESWKKLQEKLEDTEKKEKSGFSFKWIGIAASLAGGILILSLVFNSNDLSETPQIVDAPSEERIIPEENQPLEKVELASEEVIEPVKEETSGTAYKEEKREVTQMPENSAVAAVNVEEDDKEQEEVNEQPDLQLSDDRIAGKLKEVVAEISSEESKNGDITDAEVEELLRQAAAEISMQQSIADTKNIDPGSLLWEVEMELERSFREKVFDVLKDSYLKTKTAVANRSF